MTWVATAITGVGALAYFRSVSPGGINGFEWISLPIFTLLFGWISLSFVVATLGLVGLRTRQNRMESARRRSRRMQPLRRDRCALLVPVYNELPDEVFARIEAMVRELAEVGHASEFDFFVLSDSTDAETWLAEEVAWARLNDRLSADCNVYYRHRSENLGRKAGNIADFCTRWAEPYAFMIILDADSLMSASTLVEMVHRMQENDRLGILQVAPVPIGRSSLFARLQQFSAAVYGPVFVEGFSRWTGHQSNYWGHNAIIRVEAFRECCDLPLLPGKPPLGGEILSHDFVEAALMVRNGWEVRLASDLGGSYEECPTALSDYVKRDHRWCQGNLQHSRLIYSEGFLPISRFHFLSGAMAYVSSPLWILFTVTCVAGWMLDRPSLGQATWFDSYGRFGLFVVAMSLLLVPKLYGVIAVLNRGAAADHGGASRLAISACVETIGSILLSPLMALYHSQFVIWTLRGRSIRWNAQQRSEHRISFAEALSQYGPISGIGIALSLIIGLVARPLLLWFSPILAGLVLAVPIAMLMGSRWLGVGLRRLGLLLIPEESNPPRLCQLLDTAIEANSQAASSGAPRRLFQRVLREPSFFLIHRRVLMASESARQLSDENKEVIRSAARKGTSQIPSELRSSLLSDEQLLREIHLRVQVNPQLTDTEPRAAG